MMFRAVHEEVDVRQCSHMDLPELWPDAIGQAFTARARWQLLGLNPCDPVLPRVERGTSEWETGHPSILASLEETAADVRPSYRGRWQR
jgi:hypothetical protein